MGNRTIDVELEELPRIAKGLAHIGYDCGAMVTPVGAAGTGILTHLAMSAQGRSAAARAAGTSAKLATYSGTYAGMAGKVIGAYTGYRTADEMAKAGIMIRDGAGAVMFSIRTVQGKELFSFERVKTIDPNSADAPKPDGNKKTPTSAHDAAIFINKAGSEADEVDKAHQDKQYADRGAITVIPYRDKNTGQKRYIVVIPGTDPDNIKGDPHSWDNALRESGGKDGELTAQQKMIDQALKDAGAEPGSEVFLMGHSQGGMIAYNTANSTEFAKKYNVKGIYTEGSPLSGLPAKRRDFSVAYVEGKEPVPDSLGPRKKGKGWTPDERDTVINTSNSGMDGHAATEYEKALNDNPKGRKDLKQLKDFFGNGDYEAQQISVYSASTMPDGTSDLANIGTQIGRYGEAFTTSKEEGANAHIHQAITDAAMGERLPDALDPQYRDQEAGEPSASTPNMRRESLVELYQDAATLRPLRPSQSFAISSQRATPPAPQPSSSGSDAVESSGGVGSGVSATQMFEGVGRQLAENLGTTSSGDANSAGAESLMDQLDSAGASDGPHIMPYNPDTAPAEPHVMPYDPATDNVGAATMPYKPDTKLPDPPTPEPVQAPEPAPAPQPVQTPEPVAAAPQSGYTPPQVEPPASTMQAPAAQPAAQPKGEAVTGTPAGEFTPPTVEPEYTPMPYNPATDNVGAATMPYDPADTSVQEPLQMPTRVAPKTGYTPPQISGAEEIASAAFGGDYDAIGLDGLETPKWEESAQEPAYMPYDPAADSGDVANLPYNPATGSGEPIFLHNAAAPELEEVAA
ncbi:MAG: hypothetical protein Q3991_06275 [Rothia sp. (in: high G+C Gram-positive bacteria)]|uniref:hypothetical protein n=1 Tax=Rothia sp. (in: high G+C Gram-positive bacteria) TaxID=1885016 RepID=UPI0026DC5715|nr:hypothetical protein [Rothia sp. (in: high G+C Gram-positive bacteria)]MDO4884544.1 hypothetical protein [Rothia sp. (in: high G+C Gram-positive bacteria)]